MNIIKSTLKPKKINIIDLFIIVSPVVDVITSLTVKHMAFNLTLGMLFRSLFMFFLFVIFFLKEKKNKKTYVYFLLLWVYFLIYFLSISGTTLLSNFFIYVKSTIKFFYFPIMLVLIKEVFKKGALNFESLYLSAIIYSFLVVLAILSGNSYFTYASEFSGFVGWFFAPNELGSILGIMSPVLLYCFFIKTNNFFYKLTFIMALYVVVIIGTKVPIFAMATSITVYLIYNLVILYKQKNKKALINLGSNVFLLILFIVLLQGVSPIKYNLDNKTSTIEEIYFQKEQTENTDTNLNNNLIPNKKEAFKTNKCCASIGGKISSFAEKPFITKIFSSRNLYVKEGFSVWKNSGNKAIFLGEIVVAGNTNRSVEIDFFDILYSYGIIGLILYFLPLSYFLIKIILRTIKKKFVTEETFVLSVSVLLGLGISFMSGHLLIAPAVSIFLVLTLIMLYDRIIYPGDNHEK